MDALFGQPVEPRPVPSVFADATVVGLAPFRVLLSGDTEPLPYTPDSMIDLGALSVGDRVRCEFVGERVIIHGVADGASSVRSGAAFSRANRVRNGAFTVNQRGYVSGAALNPQQYGPDGWCASGVTNLVANGSFETNLTGWTVEASSAMTRVTSGGLYGPAAMRWQINATATTNAAVYCTVTGLRVGMTYTFAAWMKTLSGSRTVRLSESFTTGTAVAVGAGWQRVTYTFTATATSHIVAFYPGATGASGDAYLIDGVQAVAGIDLPDYSDTAPSPVTIALPTTPGGLATLSSGGRIFQPFERADLPAGDWTANMPGTAQGRVYNAGIAPGSRPAFAAFPFTVTLDGSDDVILELQATGGARTFGNVTLVPGTVAQPYVSRLAAEELSLCQRYYYRVPRGASETWAAVGKQRGMTAGFALLTLPMPLRALPVLDWQDVNWTDSYVFGVNVTGLTLEHQSLAPGNTVMLSATFPSNGDVQRPGALRVRDVTSRLALDAELRRFAA